MKAISLTQPWATLVAIGAKTIETRSWKTNYRGPIAIHAAKGFPKFARDLMGTEPFCSVLNEYGRCQSFHDLKDLVEHPLIPLGMVIATARLIACEPIDLYFGLGDAREAFKKEEAFGDYSPGRWAWFLDDIVKLETPVSAKGALALWEWER